jgi:hypothetical protein
MGQFSWDLVGLSKHRSIFHGIGRFLKGSVYFLKGSVYFFKGIGWFFSQVSVRFSKASADLPKDGLSGDTVCIFFQDPIAVAVGIAGCFVCLVCSLFCPVCRFIPRYCVRITQLFHKLCQNVLD